MVHVRLLEIYVHITENITEIHGLTELQVLLYMFFDAANVKWYISGSLCSRMYVSMYVQIILMKFTDIMKNYSFGLDKWFSVKSDVSNINYKIFLKISKGFNY
jgi:hypothetical protein